MPAIEPMQATGCLQCLQSGAQVKVIGIAQDDLRLYVFVLLLLRYSLYTTHCTYRHEDRRIDFTMVGGNPSGAGAGYGIGMLKVERKCCHEFAMLIMSVQFAGFASGRIIPFLIFAQWILPSTGNCFFIFFASSR